MVEVNSQVIVSALSGGALIGLSAVLMMLLFGKIAGISGAFGQLITISKGSLKTAASSWQFYFLIGLALGGWLYSKAFGINFDMRENFSPSLLILSGILVGFGTQLGNGCTSGHGVCGIARLSIRSILATCLFMGSAIVTVYLVKL
ncbi:YeeE/YedE family protein [Thalassotalea montiporae]